MSFTPPSTGSFDLSQSLGLQIPGTSLAPSSGTGGPVVDPNLSPEFARKMQVIQQANWNKSLPYYFAVCVADSNGIVTNQRVDGATLGQIGLTSNICPLNINPSNISISHNFAINVAATNHGIIEEHNGLVFRMIHISGTTGVVPLKQNRFKSPSKALKIAQSLFPAASSAVVNLLQQPKAIAGSILGGQDNDLNSLKFDLTQTGYFQFWQLNNFLIAYAESKKMSSQAFDASSLRLIFTSGKDNIAYVVTPMTFEMRKDVNNPLLYRYDITLKAWDVVSAIPLKVQPQADIPSPDAQSIIASVTGVLTTARQTIVSATNVLSGVQSDLNHMMNIYNQAILVYKGAAGLVADVGNFGSVFSSNASALMLNSSRNQQAVISMVNSPTNRTTNQPAVQAAQAAAPQASQSLSSSTATILSGVGINTSQPLTLNTPGGQQKVDPEKQNISPLAATLVTQAMATSDFQNLTIDQLDLPAVIQSGITQVLQKSQNLTSGDIQSLTNQLQNVSDNYAFSIGAMDPHYAATFNVPFNPSSTAVPTEQDIITQAALQDSITSFTSTLATGQFFLDRSPDPFLAANAHLTSQDQLATPNSTIAVPFQRGATLDTLAQQYLGDAKRSREIAVVNYLRAPFIDEIGFTLSISGANGRTFVVADISNLAISQLITLQNTTASSTRRTILNIENIGNMQWRITVDGLANLAMYTPTSDPTLFSYLPGTVGPGDMVLIPSSAVPSQFASIRPTQLFNKLSHAEQVFLIDIALDPLNAQDISVAPNGDASRSYGYSNAVQALRLAVEVERGELDRHPSFGLAVPIGSRNSDIDPSEAETMVRASITNDSRFVGADVTIEISGSEVILDVQAQGAAGTGQVPVTFQIGKQG